MGGILTSAGRLRLRGVLGQVRALSSSDELRAWLDVADRDIERAFRGCPRGEWLAKLLVAARVERPLLVYAATGAARAACTHARVADARTAQAIAAARSWAEGDATGAECWAAGCAAAQAAVDLQAASPEQACAAASAAATAFACDGEADDAFWAERGYVVEAVTKAAGAWGENVAEGASALAEVLRTYIPLAELLEAARASTAPVAPSASPASAGAPPVSASSLYLDDDAPMIAFTPILPAER